MTASAPTWEIVKGAVASGPPKRFRLWPDSELFLHVDSESDWIGLLIPWREKEPTPASPLSQILISSRVVDSQVFLTVGTRTRELFHECFLFLTALASTIREGNLSPAQALSRELEAWAALLKAASRLSLEQEIGLLGELWMINRLLESGNSQAIRSWVGVGPESHDFRFGDVDIEVKTTVSNSRVHMINNPFQVTPLPGHQLYILSIQVAPAGSSAGRTLPDAIDAVRELLSSLGESDTGFQEGIRLRGYRHIDAAQYPTRFRLRTKAALIPVDNEFPRVSTDILQAGLGAQRSARILGFHYRANLEGLGVLDGSSEFLKLIPSREGKDLF